MRTKYVVISSDQDPIRVAGTFSIENKKMTLYLNLLPGIRFYVVEDEKDKNRLRIFSGKSTRPALRPYFNQVGFGKRIEQINAYEFCMCDLNQKYYVYLNPIHFNKNVKAA